MASSPAAERKSLTSSDSKQAIVVTISDTKLTTTTTGSPIAATSSSVGLGATSSSRLSLPDASTMGHPDDPNANMTGIKGFVKRNLLPLLTISGVLGGVALGLILRYSREDNYSKREVMYVGYPGQIFLRALKALIIPLIVSSLISAIGTLDLSLSKRIGLRAVAYYMTTTVSAVILGIILVVTIRPGAGGSKDVQASGEVVNSNTPDLIMDLIRNIFPPNLIQACFQVYQTKLKDPELTPNDTASEHTMSYWEDKYNWSKGDETPYEEKDIVGVWRNGMNIMGLVSFATTLGVALSVLGSKGKPLLDVFIALSDASMIITSWLIWVSPLGILFLVASMLIEMEDFSVLLGQLGWYFLTVVIGVFFHGFIVLPAIYTVVARKLPFKFLANMTQAYITAFATASSSGTLPVTFQCLEEKNNIDSRVTRFVIPIGATINMDGTALYEAVAAIFISQVRGLDLSIGQIIAICITATAAAIGAAGIPQAGLVTMVMVLDVVGLPAEDVTLILAVDWLLDRFRTMINVVGDSLGAGIVYELSKKELAKMDENDPRAIGASGDVPLEIIDSMKM